MMTSLFLGTSRWREVKRWRQQGVEDIDVSNIDPSTGRQKQDLATHFGPPPTGRTMTGCLTAQPASLYVDPLAPAKSSTLVTGVALSAQGKPAMISSPFQQDQSVVHQGRGWLQQKLHLIGWDLVLSSWRDAKPFFFGSKMCRSRCQHFKRSGWARGWPATLFGEDVADGSCHLFSLWIICSSKLSHAAVEISCLKSWYHLLKPVRWANWWLGRWPTWHFWCCPDTDNIQDGWTRGLQLGSKPCCWDCKTLGREGRLAYSNFQMKLGRCKGNSALSRGAPIQRYDGMKIT